MSHMDKLEYIKIQMESNPRVRKELEEYVRDIAEEYLDKEDYRKTKLFRKLERIYYAFPEIESIAEEYVSCFISLDGIEGGKKGKDACELIDKIYHQFPNNRWIAENYTFLLMMRADELDSEQCNEVVSRIEKIYSHFPNNTEIKEHLEQSKDSYKRELEYERLSLYVRRLSQQIPEKPDLQELISEYVEVLGEYSAYVDEEECRRIRDIVLDYCGRFYDNVNYKQILVRIDISLIGQVEEEEGVVLLKEIQHIYKENPLVKTAALYAEALCEILYVRESYYKTALKEVKVLYNFYPDNAQIVSAYASILFIVVELQEENEQAAKKTLLELFSVAEKYPENSDVQDYLQDAKNAFAFNYEDAVFWKKQDGKNININTNCFAVLDIETTWDNKVMTIGVVIADKTTYQPEIFKYYVVLPEYQEGGIYSMFASLPSNEITKECTREEAIRDLRECLKKYGVNSIYAYNMSFDKSNLSELENFSWYDILTIAANRKYNKFIPDNMECYKSGRLKRGYGVEAIIQMISGRTDYKEIHNALFDAMDELKIMQYLKWSLESYCLDSTPVENKKCISPENVKENEFKVGDRLFHKKFGHGIVLSCSSDTVRTFGGTSYSTLTSFIGKGTKEILVPFQQLVVKEL